MDDFITRLPTVKTLAASPRIYALFSNMEGSALPSSFRIIPPLLLLFPKKTKKSFRTQRKSLVKLGVFQMKRSQLQRRKQSTCHKRFDNCSARFPPISILLDCSLVIQLNVILQNLWRARTNMGPARS